MGDRQGLRNVIFSAPSVARSLCEHVSAERVRDLWTAANDGRAMGVRLRNSMNCVVAVESMHDDRLVSSILRF